MEYQKKYSIRDTDIVKKFSSRKHEVFKINFKGNTQAIMKCFQGNSSKTLMEAEYNNLIFLRQKGISVPRILYCEGNRLFLEFLPGDLVSNLAEELNISEWIDSLALWFCKLHSIKKGKQSLLKTDANLRNFIFLKDKIYGLDFEEMKFGDPREDLAEVCFFLLMDYPKLTREKDIMARRFLKAYEEYSRMKLRDMAKFILKSKTKARFRREKFRRNKKPFNK